MLLWSCVNMKVGNMLQLVLVCCCAQNVTSGVNTIRAQEAISLENFPVHTNFKDVTMQNMVCSHCTNSAPVTVSTVTGVPHSLYSAIATMYVTVHCVPAVTVQI